MTKPTQWPCLGCGATLSGRGGKRCCGPDCRPRCSVQDCEKSRHGLTYCAAHHARWKKYGDPLTPLLRVPNEGECTVEGCERPMRKARLCESHYGQTRQRKAPPRPFLYEWSPPGRHCVVCGVPTPGRRKHCSPGCQVADSRHKGERPTSAVCDYCGESFDLNRVRTGRLQRIDTKWCPDCGRSSPDVLRLRRYGITKEFWERESAKGCQICGTTEGTLHVDHDHGCCPGQKACCGKCVRGLLCGSCNRGLGLFRDDLQRVTAAAAYLAQYLT